jgi:glycosyltransferase involved in cell wall biosynthesis
VVVITLNEEKNIRRCLESADFVNDIIVLDSYSKDKTKDICVQMGARFEQQEWLGFGLQKKRATELAKNDWVLSLDADECISKELKEEILAKWEGLDPKVGYRLPRISYFLKRWIRHGGWYPDYQLRLFHRKYSQWSDQPIHEKVIAERSMDFSNPIQHFVFNNISHQVVTNDRYSTLQMQKMKQQGKSFNWFHFFTKPFVKFVECYVLKLGFLDGMAGFIIAISAAYSVFLKWSKLWESEES